MKGQGTGGGEKVFLGELLVLLTPQGVTMISIKLRNFDFYGCLDCWKIHLEHYYAPYNAEQH